MSNDIELGTPPHKNIDVAVIGAGLTGLATANLLHQAGRRVQVFEAAPEAGGRVRSFRDPANGNVLGDRGPTWVWPEFQPTIAYWLNRLELTVYEQFSNGNSIVEAEANEAPRTMFLPAQQGSLRIEGGTSRLVEQLVCGLPSDAVQYNTRLTAIDSDAGNIKLRFQDESFSANQVVIALPPRIAINTIEWQPGLPVELVQALNGLPTWMAPHAKVVVVYEEAFWRANGLSGRIVSRVGPLMEVHDHCSIDTDTAALFGFVGWPSATRIRHKEQLPDLVIQQLVRCFGQAAAQPKHVFIEDWSRNDLIAQPQDLAEPQSHPDVGPEIVRRPIWRDRLVFAAAELATYNPGLIDGAFVAAEHAAQTAMLAVTNEQSANSA